MKFLEGKPFEKTYVPYAHKLRPEGIVTEYRIRRTLDFVDEVLDPVADVGEASPATSAIAKRFAAEVHLIKCRDFNELKAGSPEYRTIFCMEVLEHLMNPARFLVALKTRLKPRGVCYLTTPAGVFVHAMHSREHFTEYRHEKLIDLFQYTEWKVERHTVIRPFPAYYPLTGVRPLIKSLYWRTLAYKLRA